MVVHNDVPIHKYGTDSLTITNPVFFRYVFTWSDSLPQKNLILTIRGLYQSTLSDKQRQCACPEFFRAASSRTEATQFGYCASQMFGTFAKSGAYGTPSQ